MFSESLGLEMFGFQFGDEGSCGGDVPNEFLGGNMSLKELTADGGRIGIKQFVNDIQSQGAFVGECVDDGVSGASHGGFGDDETFAKGFLLDESGVLDGLSEGLAASIDIGKLLSVHFDFHVVESHTGNGGEAMFDGFDHDGIVRQGGSPILGIQAADESGDSHGGGQIGSYEDNPCSRLCGFHRHFHGDSGKESFPRDLNRFSECFLLFHLD